MTTVPDRDDRVAVDRLAPVPWADFKAELLSVYQPPMVAPSTRCKMKQVLDSLEALEIQTSADLTTGLVAKFVTSRPSGQSPHTLQSLLMVLRTICSYAETSGYVRVSPFRLRKIGKWVRVPPLEGKRHNSREEIRRILALLARDVEEREGWGGFRARRLQAVVALVAYCGLRKMEALRMQVGDVDLAAHIMWVRPHGKALKTSASQAALPIPRALDPILISWLGHRMDAPYGYPLPRECPWLFPTVNRKAPWVSGSPGSKALDRLKAVAQRAGVEGVTFQGLRRSCATHLEGHGLGPALIQRILRHTNIKTTQNHYMRADIPNLVAQTAGFDF